MVFSFGSLRLFCRFDECSEVVSLERRTADEAAVHVLFSQKLSRIGRLHATTVKDVDLCSFVLAKLLDEQATDEGMNFLRLFRGSRPAGADGPHRLVRQNQLR